jgi:hypothetical protein
LSDGLMETGEMLVVKIVVVDTSKPARTLSQTCLASLALEGQAFRKSMVPDTTDVFPQFPLRLTTRSSSHV